MKKKCSILERESANIGHVEYYAGPLKAICVLGKNAKNILTGRKMKKGKYLGIVATDGILRTGSLNQNFLRGYVLSIIENKRKYLYDFKGWFI